MPLDKDTRHRLKYQPSKPDLNASGGDFTGDHTRWPSLLVNGGGLPLKYTPYISKSNGILFNGAAGTTGAISVQADDIILSVVSQKSTQTVTITYDATSSVPLLNGTNDSASSAGFIHRLVYEIFRVPSGVSIVNVTFTPDTSDDGVVLSYVFRGPPTKIYVLDTNNIVNANNSTANPSLGSPTYINGEELYFGIAGNRNTAAANKVGQDYSTLDATSFISARTVSTEWATTEATKAITFTANASVWVGIGLPFIQNTVSNGFGQAKADILATNNGLGQAQAFINYYVQSAQTSATTTTSTVNSATIAATLGATPTVGNLLVAVVSMQGSNTYTMSGWTKATESTSTYTNGQGSGGLEKAIWYRVVQSGDTTTVAIATNTSGSTRLMHVAVAEYRGLGPNPTYIQGSYVDTTSGSSTSKAMNSVTPLSGIRSILIVNNTLNPNYNPSMPAGWTQRTHVSETGGARYTSDIGDQFVQVPDGVTAYGGTFSGAGSETAWHIGTVIFMPGSTLVPAQAQASVIGTSFGKAQVQADILQTLFGLAQSQADINQTFFGLGQAQVAIKGNAFAQAQADILATSFGEAQAQADIQQTYFGLGQAQVCVKGNAFGQAQADINAVGFGLGQANADINVTSFGLGQSQSDIQTTYFGLAQAQADILVTSFGLGQAQAKLTLNSASGFGQAQADISQTYFGESQAQADILVTVYAFGQSQADINTTSFGFGQSQTDVKQIYFSLGQSQSDIKAVSFGLGQANVYIKITVFGLGQAQADIKAQSTSRGQAQGSIKAVKFGSGQAQSLILAVGYGFGQAQSYIKLIVFGLGQAQTTIRGNAFGQAQTRINVITSRSGNAQSWIRITVNNYAQAQADINATIFGLAQANSDIKAISRRSAQAQALIVVKDIESFGQAEAFILKSAGYAQAQAKIYNTHFLLNITVSDRHSTTVTLSDHVNNDVSLSNMPTATFTVSDKHTLDLTLSDRPTMSLTVSDKEYI